MGVWTIGDGWTQPVDDQPVSKEVISTQDVADSLLRTGIVQYGKEVAGLVNVN